MHHRVRLIREVLFSNDFPEMSYDKLIIQRSDLITNDGCTHFMLQTGEIISWNYITEKWLRNAYPDNNQVLRCLFEKN